MFDHSKINIGISPINWTNDDQPALGHANNFEQILSEAALTGYDGVEIGVTFPQDTDKLLYHLNLRRLKIASQWLSIYLATMPFEYTEKLFVRELSRLKALHASCINVCEMSYNLFRSDKSMFTDRATLSNEEWKKLCSGLNALGKAAGKSGIKLCYHHHMSSVVQTEEEIAYLLAHTNPRWVHLCLDTSDLILADIAPVPFIRKFGRRIGHVHLKDLYPEKMLIAKRNDYSFRNAVKDNCFTVPGEGSGCIDFAEVFAALDDIGYSGWLIVDCEQNPQSSGPFEYALKARYYLSAMLDL